MPRRAKRREADDPRARRSIIPTTSHQRAAADAEPARSPAPEGPVPYICPGPDWPPETTTCGRIMKHPGRCPECSRIRTRLRKADRRDAKKDEAERMPIDPENYELVLPTF